MSIMYNENIPELFDRIIISLIALLLIFTPLAYGTVQPWSILIFRLTVFSSAILYLLSILITKKIVFLRSFIYFPVIILILLAMVQIVPLPAIILKTIFPGNYAIYNELNLVDKSNLYYLSINTFFTRTELLQYLCYCFIAFYVANKVRSVEKVKILLSIILAIGFIVSIIGIIQWIKQDSIVFGPFGLFINYDHFGGYLNCIIPIGLGFILTDMKASKKALIGFMTVIMSASLMLSRSRGAVLSFLGALIFLAIILFIVRKKYSRQQFIYLIVALCSIIGFILLFIYWIDWGLFVNRLKTIVLENNYFDPRFKIWEDSLKAVEEFPLAGAGYGSYSCIFQKYQKNYLELFWRYAHNDYLQLLIETGPLGILMSIVFIVTLFKIALVRVFDTQNRQIMGLLIGCTASFMTLTIHSFIDFNSHIPANAFLISVIIGIILSLSYMPGNRSKYESIEVKIKQKHSVAVFLAGTIFVLFIFVIPSVRLYAGSYYAKMKHGDEESNLKMSIKMTPDNAEYHHKLGLYYEIKASSEKDAEKRWSLLTTSEKELKEAVKNGPSSSKYWASYGWLLGNMGNKEKGVNVFLRAVALAPNNNSTDELFKEYLFK